MKYEGIKILFWGNYIDITTVKEARNNDEESVEAVACDTDKLCLLLHHMTLLDQGKSIFMTSINLSESSEQYITCRIQDFGESKDDQIHEKYHLFAHAFCGCDTSLVYMELVKLRL